MADSSGQTVAGRELLETKLYMPKWRPGLVSRPRLIERLDQGLERKLTLVSAPPGFGKSTLLAEWLDSAAAKGRLAAWVSLDQGDNDPSLFWAYFIAAAQTVRSGIGEGARSLLHSTHAPSIEQVLTTLINEINMIEEDFVLILDDYHLITDDSVHEGIGFLLEHLPPRMNLVVTSRTDPPLPLSHLRGRGELTELRDSDLSFTLDETSAFLSQSMGIELTSGDVEALETRTEGWVAGLQLAALSMQGREDTPGFIEAFAGDDRYIVDYLAEEVLLRQPERVRDFLTQTCILDLLSGALCDAVTGHEDGAEMLAELEQSNLFIIPLDDKRQWYRYHHLFQDFLKSSSVGPTAEDARELHLRAASWFENNGMVPEAIEHAQTGGDHETVARLLVANFEDFLSLGQFASIASWAASLPEEMVQLRPRLALVHAAGAMGSEDNNQNARKLASWAEEAISGIENSGGFDPKSDVNGTVVGSAGLDVLKGEFLALQLRLTSRKLSPNEVADKASQALELLPPSHRMRGAIHLIDSGIQTARSDIKSSLPALEKSIAEARRTRNSCRS